MHQLQGYSKHVTNICISKMGFTRCVRQICDEVWQEMKGDDAQPLRWTASSLGALHEGVEAYLIGIFENAYLCTVHAKRKTLLPSDID